MAIWVSKVYLRWYKSFNTDSSERRDRSNRPWNQYNERDFPFVEIPISSRVCTIVGANETGKSQLLGAIQKVIDGKLWDGTKYLSHDICRYSGLLSVSDTVWPELGLEFTFDTDAEFLRCSEALDGLGINGSDGEKLRFFVKGNGEDYLTIYDKNGQKLKSLNEKEWLEKKENAIPKVHYIRNDLEFRNQIHINQLIAQYEDEVSIAYEPVQLQSLAEELVTFDVAAVVSEANDEDSNSTTLLQSLQELQSKVGRTDFQTGDGGLERILFEDILKVPKARLIEIRDLNSNHHGYVEQLVADINHKLSESLDISQYWQQDEDFEVQLEYKAGFFYFLISDRTGSQYTFDERSGGLKYFLSYYVQTKAIRDSMGSSGSIIVMDEPDGYLSASGQRNLLSVFELLSQPVEMENGDTKRCQVIYTTHSPFLINKNFPDRISLVRKGDGAEGTQLVELVSTRQYEPIRSGLGIEAGDTLFMGTQNVILEGVSEQRILVSAIQKFGNEERIDDMLDLNRVTLVSASGAWDIPRLMRATKRSKEKQPVRVVILDDDETGRKVKDEITGESLIKKDFVATLTEMSLDTPWTKKVNTLEDLIPPKLLSHGIYDFLFKRWKCEKTSVADIQLAFEKDATKPGSQRIIDVIHEAGGGLAKQVNEVDLKAGVYESLATFLSEENPILKDCEKELDQLETVCRQICDKISEMLSKAKRESQQDRLQKSIRIEVDHFSKLYGTDLTTKADVQRCLSRLEVLPIGTSENAIKTRENILKLQEMLGSQTRHAGHKVDAQGWIARLTKLTECPWGDGSAEKSAPK